MEASALAPSLLADASPAPVTLGSSAPLATPIKPLKITPPAFVLDRTVKGHSDWVTGVSFSPHGQLASSSWDQTVKFWDALTGKQLNGVSGKLQPVQALAFSRDGRWLAAENSSNSVAVWDTATGREILTLPATNPRLPCTELGSTPSPSAQMVANWLPALTIRRFACGISAQERRCAT